MTEKKLPQSGEWWKTRDGERRYVIGNMPFNHVYKLSSTDKHENYETHTLSGQAIRDVEDGEDLVEHLPWCKSFDDTEPVAEVFPQYYETFARASSGVAFVRRDCETKYVVINKTGDVQSTHFWSEADKKRPQLTESEALARLTPKCPDCGELAGEGHADVCPMSWVTQDRVPVRLCDEIRWGAGGLWSRVMEPGNVFQGKRRHGYESGPATLQIRCRRKDLPPLPESKPEEPPVTRQRIRMWKPDNDDRTVFITDIAWTALGGCKEIKHDANGFYIESQSSP